MEESQLSQCDKINLKIAKKIEDKTCGPTARLLEPYVKSNWRISTDCGRGHIFDLHPSNFLHKGTWCKKCSGMCPEEAERKLREVIAERGETLMSPYINRHTPVTVLCQKGHIYRPHPSSLREGRTHCSWCTGTSPEAYFQRWKKILEDLHYELLSPYTGSQNPHKVRCDKNHICYPRPDSMVNKGTRCWSCFGNCPIKAKARIIAVLAERGETLESEYIDADTKVSVKCRLGHLYTLIPYNLF
jgi:ferredoxin